MDPTRLKGLGLAGRPLVHPNTGAPAAVVRGLDAGKAKAKGLPLLDQERYVVEACYRELRRHAGVFVVAQGVEHELDLLRPVYPQIVSSTETRFDVPVIAQVLRNLVAEGVSVRHLRGVLETMLSIKETEHLKVGAKKAFYAYADFLGPAQSGVSAQAVGPVGLAEAVRLALRDYIVYRYARGHETLPAYRVAQDLEPLIEKSAEDRVAEEELLAIREAVWEGIGKASFPPPVIVTSSSVRRALKGLIEIELPEVVVLSDEELPPGMKVQTLGHISLRSH
jgi:type III secretion protein V